jgi:hypothetical protein
LVDELTPGRTFLDLKPDDLLIRAPPRLDSRQTSDGAPDNGVVESFHAGLERDSFQDRVFGVEPDSFAVESPRAPAGPSACLPGRALCSSLAASSLACHTLLVSRPKSC